MKPIDYFRSLDLRGKEQYAERAKTTLAYMRLTIFHSDGPRKRPSEELVIRLAEASEGNVTLDEAIEYFLVEPVKRTAEAKASNQRMSKDAEAEHKHFDAVSNDNHALSAG